MIILKCNECGKELDYEGNQFVYDCAGCGGVLEKMDNEESPTNDEIDGSGAILAPVICLSCGQNVIENCKCGPTFTRNGDTSYIPN